MYFTTKLLLSQPLIRVIEMSGWKKGIKNVFRVVTNEGAQEEIEALQRKMEGKRKRNREETMNERLERLERENRHVKRVGVAALATITAAMLMGQVAPPRASKVVEADEFVLRDGKGAVRAMLGFKAGAPLLSFYDEEQTLRIGLGFAATGLPTVAILNKDGNIRSSLALLANDTTALYLYDRNERPHAVLAVETDGTPSLSLFGKDKEGNAILGIDGKGVSGLTLSDQSRITRAVLGSISLETRDTGVIETRPESSLVLFDSAGKVIWSAP